MQTQINSSYLCIRILAEDAKYRQFSRDSLSRASRSAEQHVAVTVIERVKDLCLYRIEMSEIVQRLQEAVIQCRDR